MDQIEVEAFNKINRMRTAYHEAAHAVIGRVLSLPIKHVTIKREGGDDGKTVFERSTTDSLLTMNKATRLNKALSVLAGPLGQEKLIERELVEDPACDWFHAKQLEITFNEGNRSDYEYVKLIITTLVGTDQGEGIRYSVAEVKKMLAKLERRARVLVRKHQQAIEVVAAKLLADETLTGDDIDAIIKLSKTPEVSALLNRLRAAD